MLLAPLEVSHGMADVDTITTIIDDKSVVKYVSQNCKNILGYNSSELLATVYNRRDGKYRRPHKDGFVVTVELISSTMLPLGETLLVERVLECSNSDENGAHSDSTSHATFDAEGSPIISKRIHSVESAKTNAAGFR